ncbi:MAG: hydroxyethylthiazole kinase [Lentisphaeria bacterium]
MDLTPYLNNVKQQCPLIHCLTNTVTINDCANILLACGASPTMADEISEVEEITTIAAGLYINIGTLNKLAIKAMLTSGKKADDMGKPIVLDPVGIGASQIRRDTVAKLLENMTFSCIRGNVSEIKSLASGSKSTRGVDADTSDLVCDANLDAYILFAKKLSEKTCSIIAISGAIDIVADKDRACLIRNGHAMMSQITGTGCMLTAMLGAYCAANPNNLWEATIAGIVAMGLAGELAYKKVEKNHAGTGSFRVWLMDEISTMTAEKLQQGAKIEIR